MPTRGKYADAVDDGRCHARVRGTEERCKAPACTGLKVCNHHGGSTPNAMALTRTMKAVAELQQLGEDVPPIEDAVTALLDVAARARRLMLVLEAQVSALKAVRWASGQGEQTRGELTAYERSLDRVARILIEINKLDLEERRLRLEERHVGVIVGTVTAVMTHLGLRPGTPEWAAVGKVAAESLRRAGGVVPGIPVQARVVAVDGIERPDAG